MNKELKGSAVFLITLLVYVLAEPFIAIFTDKLWIILLFKLLFVGAIIILLKDWFSFKLKFDFLAIVTGILIGVIWVLIDGFYTPFSVGSVKIYSSVDIILKIFVGIIIAPVIEEFFTRFFLHRYVQSKNWLTEKMGTYSFAPFIITTLFFGLSHNRWLAGIITGIILNLLWYRKKDMNSVIVAHGIANLVLGILVLTLGLWTFW